MTKTSKQQRRSASAPATVLDSFSPTVRDLLSIALLYLLAFVVFREVILNDMAFSSQGDTIAAITYGHAGTVLQEKEGRDVLWMPFFFSGMPTFGNLAFLPHDVNYIQRILTKILMLIFLNGTWTWFVGYYFIGGVFMFLLLRHLEFLRPIALFGAITFMLSPYAVGLAGEGHGSKLMALVYLPLLFLLAHTLFRRRDALSTGLVAAALGTLLLTNHLQIVYYELGLLTLYLIYYVITEARQGLRAVSGGTLLFLAALILGFCISSYVYLSVQEYAQYSIRGGGTQGSTGGLTWDYATNWSWHPGELITLLLPGFYGMQASLYWGPVLPWTNSSVYIGLLPLFFSILALLYRRNSMTIFLAVVSVIVLLVSLGRNFAPLYELLFVTLPFFNKFRAPSMILHLLPFLLGILGAYGLAFLLNAQEQLKEEQRQKLLKIFLMATWGMLALLGCAIILKGWLFDSLSGTMFLREGEAAQYRQQFGQQAARAISQVKQMRFDVFWKDLTRFAALGSIAMGGTWMFLRRSLRVNLYAAGVVIFVIVDLWSVSAKYITPVPDKDIEGSLRPSATILYLKEQKGLFRIFPVGQTFMDNSYAYHGLQSIGGYSPAKLKIYQTMLDSCLERGGTGILPWNLNVLNMLNVEYLVVPGLLPETSPFKQVNVDQTQRLITYMNPAALPRAWYVGDITVAGSDHEVFQKLNAPDFDPARTAICAIRPAAPVETPDSGSLPVITQYESGRIALHSDTKVPTLLVLSEIYYPAGWKAFVDGEETEILRTNYVLRSIPVPAGNHEIEFRFEPETYRIGWILSNAAWGVTALLVLFGAWRLPSVRSRFSRSGSSSSPTES